MKELYDVIRSIQRDGFDTLIDMGAAERYYAVGLAATTPVRRVVAFEAEERGRSLLKEMAVRNSVSTRIEIRGRCEAADLNKRLRVFGKNRAHLRRGRIRNHSP
jgi:precorrin-6B methylase 2